MSDFEKTNETPPASPLSSQEQPKAAGLGGRILKAWGLVRIPIWGKIALLLALIFMASIGYLKTSLLDHHDAPLPTEEDIRAVESRQQLPDFEFQTNQGKSKKLSDYRGKVVVLSFWASWCTPCLVEMPLFKELYNDLSNRGLEVVPLNVDENATEAKDFITKFWGAESLPFPNYMDLGQKVAQQLKVDTLPSNFVIDRQGRLVFTATGANDWSKGPTVDLLEMLLAEK